MQSRPSRNTRSIVAAARSSSRLAAALTGCVLTLSTACGPGTIHAGDADTDQPSQEPEQRVGAPSSDAGATESRIPASDAGVPPRPAQPDAGGPFGSMTVAPQPGSPPECAGIPLPSAEAWFARYGTVAPRLTAPVVSVDDFGAKGDGKTDDTRAIQQAIASLTAGGSVRFTAGKTYVKTDLLVVDRPDVRLWGYGAVLYSIITDEEAELKGDARIAVHLSAPRTAIYGFTIATNLRQRPPGHANNKGIHVSSDDQQVIGNRLAYAGILARFARGFLIAGNVVCRSTSDGIHTTSGSSDGIIAANTVRETGDDMIAVVNYGLGEPTVGNVLIEENDVSGQYWGRGISVVGGRDVTIRDNRISRTTVGAGILIHSETAYETADVRNVRIEGNVIHDVQRSPPAYDPDQKAKITGHAAIDVYGQGSQKVSQVLIRDNTIDHTIKDGVQVRGNACGIGIAGNSMSQIGDLPIAIESASTAACPVACSGNTLSGSAVSDPSCRSEMPQVTGSSVLD